MSQVALRSCLLNSSICSGFNWFFGGGVGVGFFLNAATKASLLCQEKKKHFYEQIHLLRLRIPEFLECVQTYFCALPFGMSHSLVPKGVDAFTEMLSAPVDGGDEAVLMSFSFRHYLKRAFIFFALPCLIKNSDVCFFEQHCYCFIHFKRCLL